MLGRDEGIGWRKRYVSHIDLSRGQEESGGRRGGWHQLRNRHRGRLRLGRMNVKAVTEHAEVFKT